MAYNFGASDGNLVLLATFTPSAVSILEFKSLISSTYDDYVLIFTQLHGDQAFADLQMQFSSNNGVAYISAANYAYGFDFQNSGGGNRFLGTGQTLVAIATDYENVANSQMAGRVYFYNISSGSFMPVYTTSQMGSGSFCTMGIGGGSYNVATAVNAFKLFPSAGTFSGLFKFYGVQK